MGLEGAKKLFWAVVEEATLIKWECFAMTVVVWLQCTLGKQNEMYKLAVPVVTACMWLISKGNADVHSIITLYKVMVTHEITIPQGVARLAGQFGGGFVACLIVMVLDRHTDVANYPETNVENADNFTKFLYEGIATSIVLLVFNKITASGSEAGAAFGYAAILYVLCDFVTNPSRVVGPHFLKKGGPPDFDDMWPTWLGPVLGAGGFGLFQLFMEGNPPALFIWIGSKFGGKCTCCTKKSGGDDSKTEPEKPVATPEVQYPVDP